MYYQSDNAHLKKLVSFVLYLRKQENQWRLGLLFKKKKNWGCYKKLVCPMTPIDVTNDFLGNNMLFFQLFTHLLELFT